MCQSAEVSFGEALRTLFKLIFLGLSWTIKRGRKIIIKTQGRSIGLSISQTRGKKKGKGKVEGKVEGEGEGKGEGKGEGEGKVEGE